MWNFTKVKLVTKIEKSRKLSFILELWYLASYCYCGDFFFTDFFQNNGFKKSSNMALSD